MEVRTVGTLSVSDPSQVSEARRFVAAVADRVSLKEATTARTAIVVTELATNMLKHAKGGELIVGVAHDTASRELVLVAIDKGPGIRSVSESLRDGYSTAGSPGTGLGAISRLADSFEIYSAPGSGTAVLARIRDAGLQPSAAAGRTVCAGISVARRGEDLNGDAWAFGERGNCAHVLLCDGLGHGADAHTASQEAVRIFRANPGAAPADVMTLIHAALRSTRGAVVACGEIDLERRAVTYAGIGNISAVILGPEREHNLVSMPGTMGHELRRIQPFSYSWPDGAILVMHTDGLSRRWNPAEYAGLMSRHPALIAAVLYRDHRRDHDDATVVVAREQRSSA